MARHPFLSDGWISGAQAIREEYESRLAAPPVAVKVNLVVEHVPFGEPTRHAHVETSEGGNRVDLGHVEAPDVTVTTDYETAKAIFVGGDPQVGIQAFMAGKVRIQGDMTKLLAGIQQPADPLASEVRDRIRAITE